MHGCVGYVVFHDRLKEVDVMSNAETLGLLKALKIITERAETTKEVIEAIERIQDKIKEPNARP